MVEKLKESASKVKTRAKLAYAGMTGTMIAMTAPTVMAAGSNTSTAAESNDSSTSADAAVGAIIGQILSVFRYIGILLLVWSIGMLILAFKNEDADSKSRAMMLLVVSIILIFLKSLVEAILGATGVSVTVADASTVK